MVNTPRDAIKTFIASGIDWLVLGDYVVKKPSVDLTPAAEQAVAAVAR